MLRPGDYLIVDTSPLFFSKSVVIAQGKQSIVLCMNRVMYISTLRARRSWPICASKQHKGS